MLLEIKKIPVKRLRGNQFKIVYVVKCDTCGAIKEKYPCHAQKKEHFCSLKCANVAQQPNGILDLKKKHICQEHYGVDNPFQADEVKESCRKTSIKKYGVSYPQTLDIVKEKVRQTCRQRYGADSPFQAEIVKERIRKATFEHYGFENPNQSPLVRKKSIKTLRNHPIVKHWKTGEECYSHSGYEYATLLWLNKHQYDFDWQIPFSTPLLTPIRHTKSIYIIDLYIKDGPFANMYIEIKGSWYRESTRQKWDWFHSEYANSLLWMRTELQHLGILKRDVPHPDLFT